MSKKNNIWHMMKAFYDAQKQMREHRYQKVDYLKRGAQTENSWKDKEHPLSLKDMEERTQGSQKKRLETLYKRHGWGGGRDY